MEKYHFIAIGGTGMSGLAKYLIEEGNIVSGSDIQESKYTTKLKKLGATVYIGHNENNIPKDAVIVVSSAIKDDNPELIFAKKSGLRILHRSDLLAKLSENAKIQKKCFIGFAGTHGKTTTSGLSSYLLDKAGRNPSFVVGGIIPDSGINSQYKDGQHFIAEMDESDGTIVKYFPDILVINNLENDHLDFYTNGMTDLIKTFNKVISQSKKVLVNIDNAGVKQLSGNFITFGLNNADYVAKNIIYSNEGFRFDVYKNDKLILHVSSPLNGVHNVYNNLAVVAALNEAGVDLSLIKPHFKSFSGMGRRFQKEGEINGIEIYDDYAHHPTEISATLDAAGKKYSDKTIVAVFQPHRYTRLKCLWNEFKKAFKNADRVIVTDVYAASEFPITGINSENFASEMDIAEYISGNMEEVAKKLYPTLKQGDVVIGLGAGTITTLGKYLKEQGECYLATKC